MQCRQWQQQHDAGIDASALRVKHQRNAGKRQRCTGQTFEGSATTLAQCRQQGQLDAANDTSAMRARTPVQRQKNAIAALARPSKAKSLWADVGYSNKAMGDNNERDNDASPATCRDCIMTDRMPVRDAGGNAGVPRVATPA
jgi:hypothetical protein